MDRKIKRGDMYYAELTQGVGSEQSGKLLRKVSKALAVSVGFYK